MRNHMAKFLKDSLRWLPGALVSLVLIAVILYFVDLRAMVAAARSANYAILAGAMGLSFVWLAVRAVVWRTLLRERAGYKDVFFTVGEGYLLNNFLPFRLGEIGRAFLLSRKSGMHFVEILPTIVIERAVDLVFSAIIFIAALPYVVGASGSEQIGLAVAVVMTAGLFGLYLLARHRQWAMDAFRKLAVRWKVLGKADSLMEPFFEGLAVLTDGWLFTRFLFWMALNWVIAIGSYFLMTLAFFPQAEPAWGMVVLSAAAFGGAIPALPGAVGTFEGAIGGALFLLTGNESTSLTVAITARLYNYLNSSVIGGLGLAREGQTLSGIYRQLLSLRNRAKTTESE
jgi:uncharacterized protein (TIRG00374 family)